MKLDLIEAQIQEETAEFIQSRLREISAAVEVAAAPRIGGHEAGLVFGDVAGKAA